MLSRTIIGHTRCLIIEKISRRFDIVVGHIAGVTIFFNNIYIFKLQKKLCFRKIIYEVT